MYIYIYSMKEVHKLILQVMEIEKRAGIIKMNEAVHK